MKQRKVPLGVTAFAALSAAAFLFVQITYSFPTSEVYDLSDYFFSARVDDRPSWRTLTPVWAGPQHSRIVLDPSFRVSPKVSSFPETWIPVSGQAPESYPRAPPFAA